VIILLVSTTSIRKGRKISIDRFAAYPELTATYFNEVGIDCCGSTTCRLESWKKMNALIDKSLKLAAILNRYHFLLTIGSHINKPIILYSQSFKYRKCHESDFFGIPIEDHGIRFSEALEFSRVTVPGNLKDVWEETYR
jgi:hypothetical protein